MKRSRRIINLLTLFPFAAAMIALALAPDEIPAHWGLSGGADRMGSKWELLLWPGIILLLRLLLGGIEKLVREKDREGEKNARYIASSTIAALALMDFLSLYFMRFSISRDFDIDDYNSAVWQISMSLAGLSLIPYGNMLPKLRLNSTVGLRTRYSMKNEETWALCQRFGGRSMIAAGVVIIICAQLMPDIRSFIALLAVTVIMLIADCRYAKWAYYKTLGSRKEDDQ